MGAAVGVDAGHGVDPGGDRVPVQPGELAGGIPVAGVVRKDGALAVPRHLADREHGLDVCWHEIAPSCLREAGNVIGRTGPGMAVPGPGAWWVRSWPLRPG